MGRQKTFGFVVSYEISGGLVETWFKTLTAARDHADALERTGVTDFSIQILDPDTSQTMVPSSLRATDLPEQQAPANQLPESKTGLPPSYPPVLPDGH